MVDEKSPCPWAAHSPARDRFYAHLGEWLLTVRLWCQLFILPLAQDYFKQVEGWGLSLQLKIQAGWRSCNAVASPAGV